MTDDLVIVGCGGFGREVADLVRDLNAAHDVSPPFDFKGFLDDAPSELNLARVEKLGTTVIGTIEDSAASLAGVKYVVGVGRGVARRDLASRAEAAGLVAATLVHPSARIGTEVTLGEGSVICAGVTITTNISIGRHVHVDRHTTIGHDSTVGGFATIHPLVAVSGDCHIGVAATIGTHSAVLPGVSVGAEALVGAGACVVKDVAASIVVKGVPAT